MTNFYIRLRFFEEINYVVSSSMRNEITRVGWTNFFCQSVGQNTYLMEIHSRPSLIQRLILKIAILHFPLTFACGIIPFRFLAWSLVHPVSGKMKKKKKKKTLHKIFWLRREEEYFAYFLYLYALYAYSGTPFIWTPFTYTKEILVVSGRLNFYRAPIHLNYCRASIHLSECLTVRCKQ